MDQFTALAVALPPEARRQMEEAIRQVAHSQVIRHFANAECEVCLEPLTIPVEVHTKCAGTNLRICLRCTRRHFQLNITPDQRVPVRHIKCCTQQINTAGLNARKVYTIQHDFMRILDQDVPITCECTCGAKFAAEDGESRVKYHAHMGDGTCPLSTWMCPFCNERITGFAMIKHITKSTIEGGCRFKDALVRHVHTELQPGRRTRW